ncbi:Protein of unknown function [Granulicella rosea]|uniref:DUF3106 domain-containing protein n=2 Tax=Granulicella rosea TaxID=474952 RepID=A0A239E5W8_9BACT|nr:Protein of unknown function [Granulicella rosea]
MLRAASVAAMLFAVSVVAQPPTKIPPRTMNAHPSKTPQPQHLAEWMDSHRNLSPAAQQQALEHEPGFQSMKPDVQQRMRDRLTELNNMPPAQRQRVLARTQAMEKLTMPQRQQVRGAMQQLGALPEDRRKVVARTFRDMRDMPPNQREAYMNSEWYRGQFNDQERATLSNLMAVEPMLPLTPAVRTAPPVPQR